MKRKFAILFSAVLIAASVAGCKNYGGTGVTPPPHPAGDDEDTGVPPPPR